MSLHSGLTFALMGVAACEVPNPAYDPYVHTTSDGGETSDSGGKQSDAARAGDSDGQAFTGTDAGLDLDASALKPDGAPPIDGPVPTPDVAPPIDGPVLKPDVGPPDPPPDYARQSQSCAADPSLVLCMAFEGKVVDDSSLALSFTPVAVAYKPEGLGQALVSSAQTRIVNNTLTAAGVPYVTIQAWLNPSRMPSVGRRFGIVDYQPQYSMFILPGGEITCGCDGLRNITTAPLIEPNVWQSVACTIDSQAIRVWWNGKVRAQVAVDGLCPHANDTAGMAVLGNVTAGGSPYPESFEGLADNVRVWNRARTADEICRDALVCVP